MEAPDNPILYIEAFGPTPDLAHRHRVPGAAIVYRTREGKLRAPKGGYTAGELMWHRPREVYLVDDSPHVCELECVVAFGPEAEMSALNFSVVWQITDPAEAVAQRLTQPHELCRVAIEAWCQRAVDLTGISSAAQLFGLVSRQLPQRVNLPGIRVDIANLRSISAAGTDGSSQASVLSALLGNDQRAKWQEDFELAQASLLGLPGGHDWTGDEVLAEEVVTLTRQAVQRYADLVERLGEMLPYDGEADL